MESNMPVLIILAGGASSRMWPLREKSLLRFGDKPLLLHQLQCYISLGFEHVILVGNHENAETLRDLIQMLDGIEVRVAVQTEPLGMGDALLRAEHVLKDQFNSLDGVPIYINQVHDVVQEQLHKDILNAYQMDSGKTYLAAKEMADYFPGGYFQIDEQGRILSIIEKPGAENRPSNLVNIVAHLHIDAAALFTAIREEYAAATTSDDHYERAMDKLMKISPYQAIPYQGRWSALKYPWHVLDIMGDFLNQIEGQQIASGVFIAPTASIIGNVMIEEGAKVFPGAAIVGPAYIGRGTIVGNNALIRHSMVLENCEVGFTTEVARSYVAGGCSLHACRVLDSVFAEGVNFSAGCTTANLRIDHGTVSSKVKGQKIDSGRNKFGAVIGQNAFLGVDVMTMPGVKIGGGAQVGPGTHVHQDISDRQRVFVKQVLEIVEVPVSDSNTKD
jgi:UDP-N-acetylglucosamine diphosphorylase / glucose-1-phosphate thymidylyltransferase / UDP-N-acetylgalactosamine diphosphorylase / glucosamine-1-phosphate N-acetyltransferase / galactosamine-1-phosphate N-acetyltransferase